MKVKLVSYTPDAVELLIFTKSTRLKRDAALWETIMGWPHERKMEELAYMARTIPSSWEFVTYAFSIEGVSRAFTHQFVRTRNASYAQQTMRVVNPSGDNGECFEYTRGPSVTYTRPLGDADVDWKAFDRATIYDETMRTINKAYGKLLELGATTDDARGLLPTNICTNIMASFNLRALSDLIKKRSSGRVQDEYRDVAIAMRTAVYEVHPWANSFLEPRQHSVVKKLKEIAASVRDTNVPLANDIDKEADILTADLNA